ncbi:MAG: thiopurine S-methyltransferase [Steroidobacteraceae bacterium]
MQPEFWLERWQTREIGFHRSYVHPMLERWWPTLGVSPDRAVYVPLCGKSLDLHWLADRGHRVTGGELSPIAIREFFEEAGLEPAAATLGTHVKHAAGPYTLIEGDALALAPSDVGALGAAYDRAALVALPPDLRRRHARTLASLLPAGAPVLLISFEYDQAKMDGPPFSVQAAEVRALFEPDFDVLELERNEVIGESPRFVEAGLDALHEVAWKLVRRG